jgi:hypothetical protein
MEAMTSKNRVGRPRQKDDRLPQQKNLPMRPSDNFFRVQRRRKLGFILGDACVVLVAAIPDRAPNNEGPQWRRDEGFCKPPG